MTNTQTVVDAPHKDLRRARAASALADPDHDRLGDRDRADLPRARGQAERPGGARAAAQRLAHRLRLRGRAADDASRRSTACCAAAADGPLAGILGYEERPLVSVDYKDDPRSAIVDALSTMVVDGTQVKILAWYDNEWGYANRLVELARNVAAEPRRDVRRAPRAAAAAERARRPAQLRARDRRLLGRHAHRRRDPHARALLLLRARLHARSRSPRCSCSTRSSASSRTSSAAGWRRGSGCKATLVMGLGDAGRRARRCSALAPDGAGSSCPT